MRQATVDTWRPAGTRYNRPPGGTGTLRSELPSSHARYYGFTLKVWPRNCAKKGRGRGGLMLMGGLSLSAEG